MLAPCGLLCDLLARPELTTIATPGPTLGWMLRSTAPDDAQTACHVLVASSAQLIEAQQGDFWNTGKIERSESLHLPYGGAPLELTICPYAVGWPTSTNSSPVDSTATR